MISGFLDCLKDCSVCVVFVCTSCVLGATRVQWAGREPRRYRGRDLQYLQSTNACGHLVDVSVVRRVELLGIRRTGQRREGRRCRCGCPSGLAALQSATAIRPTTTTTTDSVPRLLGHSSTAFVSSCINKLFIQFQLLRVIATSQLIICVCHVCEPGRPRVLKQPSHSVNESGIKQRSPPVTGSFPCIF